KIRDRYPDAWVLVTLSPMLSDAEPAGQLKRSKARAYLEEVVALAEARNDEKVRFLELDEQRESDGYGCASHPSATTQKKMAAKLVDAVLELDDG
ncbi:MAG: endo-1,4-beta-glucanase, partial [Polyangiaceae bacterium]|nr:endo-1,4-beta-glucanase [Polyangiaceae bacterium]